MQSNPPRSTAGQSGSSKRRRVDADAVDRLGGLPDHLLHAMLSSLGSRQAVQTSVLSRRWRRLWRDVPCVAIDEREFAGREQWERFEDFADRMLTSIPLETRLDAFHLHLVRQDLGRHCPALEELHIEGCWIQRLRAVASPTLRSLAIVKPRRSSPCVHFRIAAPRLACLRLEIPYDGEDCHCVAKEAAAPEPLASLAEASIRLTETVHDHYWLPNNRATRRRKLEFLKSMRSFLPLLPNVTKLHLAGFTTTALLEEESQEFPLTPP